MCIRDSYTPIQINITTSTLDPLDSQRINVFPNPFSTHLSIESDTNQSIELYDLKGTIIYRGDSFSLRDRDFSSLYPGSYFLRSVDSGQIIKLKKIGGEK